MEHIWACGVIAQIDPMKRNCEPQKSSCFGQLVDLCHYGILLRGSLKPMGILIKCYIQPGFLWGMMVVCWVPPLYIEPNHSYGFRCFHPRGLFRPPSDVPEFARWLWFQIFCIFTPNLWKWSQLTNIFQMGWFNHQLVFNETCSVSISSSNQDMFFLRISSKMTSTIMGI